ncbi:hypothetical protein GW17_00038008 [Ensete ventricosum]|nr:hypothetical protein GW17_00038008 [Ensete ventricosum]
MGKGEEKLAISKTNKKPHRTAEDLESLQSDVVSFASSLGLVPPTLSSASSYGFDDSDFRKSGPLKPLDAHESKLPSSVSAAGDKGGAKKEPGSKPLPKPHPLRIDPFFKNSHEKKGRPEVSLMKASSLSGHWYVDAEELEAKVLGPDGRNKVTNLGIGEFKKLVEKKKEVAERLLAQYTEDYGSSRRKSGDMRLLEVTASFTSGTGSLAMEFIVPWFHDNNWVRKCHMQWSSPEACIQLYGPRTGNLTDRDVPPVPGGIEKSRGVCLCVTVLVHLAGIFSCIAHEYSQCFRLPKHLSEARLKGLKMV